jgi:ATP/maltotriose-dependent transcriptional regulator MalT
MFWAITSLRKTFVSFRRLQAYEKPLLLVLGDYKPTTNNSINCLRRLIVYYKHLFIISFGR